MKGNPTGGGAIIQQEKRIETGKVQNREFREVLTTVTP